MEGNGLSGHSRDYRYVENWSLLDVKTVIFVLHAVSMPERIVINPL